MWKLLGIIAAVVIFAVAVLFGLVCWGGAKMTVAQDDANDGGW